MTEFNYEFHKFVFKERGQMHMGYTSPVRIFYLYDDKDKFYINLLSQIVIPQKVECVNWDNDIQNSLRTSGKILDKIDIFVVLISKNLLLNYNLLKILINNYEESERVVLFIIDNILNNTDERLKIYVDWNKKYNELNSLPFTNKDISNTVIIIQKAIALLPDRLDLLCPAMNTINDPLTYFIFDICKHIEKHFKISDFKKYSDEEIITHLDFIKKELERGSDMKTIINNHGQIYSIQEQNGPIVAPTGDNPTIDMKKNDLDLDKIENELNSLIDSAKNDLAALNKEYSDDILFLLEDILSAVQSKNKKRLGTYIGNLNSAIGICINAPKLYNNLKDIIDTAQKLLS